MIKRKLAALTLLCATVAASLLGCGGGGGSTPPVPIPAPAPTPLPVPIAVEPQPITTIAALTYTDLRKVDALNRLNAVRASAGLGLLQQQAQLDTAAQAHSDYQATNAVKGHFEDSTKPGFTGVDPGARITAAGYLWQAAAEVIAFDSVPGAQSVDLLMSVPYHRVAMLLYRPTDAGVGVAVSQSTRFNAVTIDMAYPPGEGQGAPAVPVVVLPLADATNVATSMLGFESPNPIPENNGSAAGYPVSLQVNEGKVLKVTSFTLTLPDGSPVPTKLLEPDTDPFLLSFGIKYFACALARSPLAANTTYLASFLGTVDGTPLKKSWSFTTAP